MSGGHDDHGHGGGGGSKASGPSHSVTKGAASTMTGMFGFLFTGLFDGNGGGGGGHGHH